MHLIFFCAPLYGIFGAPLFFYVRSFGAPHERVRLQITRQQHIPTVERDSKRGIFFLFRSDISLRASMSSFTSKPIKVWARRWFTTPTSFPHTPKPIVFSFQKTMMRRRRRNTLTA
jgi:hypothetical protein